MTGKIPVLAAKTVAHQYGLKQCLLIGFDGEFAHVVTYGRTKVDCAAAAKAQDFWTGNIREFSFQGLPGGWQPIETAPKDGKPILVWWPIRKVNDEGMPTGEVIGGCSIVTEWNGGTWLEPDVLNSLNSNYNNDDAEYATAPSHWMSLPSPPPTDGTDGR